MPKRIQLHDQQEKVTATCAYIADWLALVQRLTALTRLKYGISSKELLRVEIVLASLSHQMAALGQLQSSVVAPGPRVTPEMKLNYIGCLQNCWKQLSLDDPLCQAADPKTHPYLYYASPITEEAYQGSLEGFLADQL
jgi:hypothetical protein